MTTDARHAIGVKDLEVSFGDNEVLRGLSLDVETREALGIVGASGSGKSVLLRTILGFIAPWTGRVEVLGTDPRSEDSDAIDRLRRRWGIAFQHGALFSSLTVAENVQAPMRRLELPTDLMEELARLRLQMVGLEARHGALLPRALSGGMRKRAALARALAIGPDLLFLDEPTSGLDPVGAAAIDDLIRELQSKLGLTVVMVTHDVETLEVVCDRVAVLIDGRIEVIGALEEVREHDHPWVRRYFAGARGSAAAGEDG